MVYGKIDMAKRTAVESKYLEFHRTVWIGKTEKIDVISRSQQSLLGQIKWFGRWRQYCFWPSPNTIFNTDCMADISTVIKELMAERRGKDD